MEIKDIISIALSVISVVITILLFYIQKPENITPLTIILSVTIISFSVIGFLIIYIWSKWRDLVKKVIENKKEMNEINKSLKPDEFYNNMEVRLRVLEKLSEKKGKKAQTGIDPRIIYWILLLILLILLLKSIGLF